MKKGWEYKTLLDVCNVYQPKTISTSKLVDNGSYFVYGANGIIGKYIDYNHEESEVLLTCRGASCGNINVSKPKSWINGNAMVIHPLNDNIAKEYLFYYLKVIDYSKVITGAAQPQITRSSLSDTIIQYPSLAEQHRIVSYLDTTFANIDKLKDKAATALAEAKSLFQAALTEAMKPKEGWEEKTLGEIATDMYRGAGIKRDQITEVGFPCVRYGEIYTTYNYSFDECVSHTTESIIKPKKYFEYGDILFAITGESVEDIGKCIAYTGKEKCLCGGDIVVMKHNQDPKFLAYALSTKEAIRQKGMGKVKLKVVHTNVPSLKLISIYLPKDIKEQHLIVTRLDTLSSNIRKLEENYRRTLEECDALKQAVLREVFE